jgi:hypothetical protein
MGVMPMTKRRLGGKLRDIRAFSGGLYGRVLKISRVDVMGRATLGIMTSASPTLASVGQACAQARHPARDAAPFAGAGRYVISSRRRPSKKPPGPGHAP